MRFLIEGRLRPSCGLTPADYFDLAVREWEMVLGWLSSGDRARLRASRLGARRHPSRRRPVRGRRARARGLAAARPYAVVTVRRSDMPPAPQLRPAARRGSRSLARGPRSGAPGHRPARRSPSRRRPRSSTTFEQGQVHPSRERGPPGDERGEAADGVGARLERGQGLGGAVDAARRDQPRARPDGAAELPDRFEDVGEQLRSRQAARLAGRAVARRRGACCRS